MTSGLGKIEVNFLLHPKHSYPSLGTLEPDGNTAETTSGGAVPLAATAFSLAGLSGFTPVRTFPSLKAFEASLDLSLKVWKNQSHVVIVGGVDSKPSVISAHHER